MNIDEQLLIYGTPLTGAESALDCARLARAQYLKTKLRRLLDQLPFGDVLDTLTDLTKGVILGCAIQQQVVTDANIINRFKAVVAAQLEFYGGAEFVVEMLEVNAQKLSGLMARYYQAKAAIAAAQDEDTVMSVDIEETQD